MISIAGPYGESKIGEQNAYWNRGTKFKKAEQYSRLRCFPRLDETKNQRFEKNRHKKPTSSINPRSHGASMNIRLKARKSPARPPEQVSKSIRNTLFFYFF